MFPIVFLMKRLLQIFLLLLTAGCISLNLHKTYNYEASDWVVRHYYYKPSVDVIKLTQLFSLLAIHIRKSDIREWRDYRFVFESFESKYCNEKEVEIIKRFNTIWLEKNVQGAFRATSAQPWLVTEIMRMISKIIDMEYDRPRME